MLQQMSGERVNQRIDIEPRVCWITRGAVQGAKRRGDQWIVKLHRIAQRQLA
jgi:hypothetical protein